METLLVLWGAHFPLRYIAACRQHFFNVSIKFVSNRAHDGLKVWGLAAIDLGLYLPVLWAEYFFFVHPIYYLRPSSLFRSYSQLRSGVI